MLRAPSEPPEKVGKNRIVSDKKMAWGTRRGAEWVKNQKSAQVVDFPHIRGEICQSLVTSSPTRGNSPADGEVNVAYVSG
jgi:hypothetical protein